MIRVLFIHRDLPFHGGVANTFLDFARHRNAERVDMHVGSFGIPSDHMIESFGAIAVPVHHVGDDGYARPLQRLRALVDRYRFDVILCGSLKTYLIAKGATVGLRCRVMFRIASIPLVISGPYKRTLYRATARHDTIVFNSQAVANTHSYGWHRGTTKVVYNGVTDPFDDDEARPYPRRRRSEFGIPDDAFVVGYTAEFIAWKDHETILAAHAALAHRYPKLYLVLLGAGELLRDLEASARTRPGYAQVRFMGPRTDARQLLGLMDAYVHPARGEGFGRAIVEAMLAGLPAVAADTGSLPEIVLAGEVGLLFRPGDSHDCAAKIEMLIADRDLRDGLGARGRASCLERFSPHTFAESYTALFEVEARRL